MMVWKRRYSWWHGSHGEGRAVLKGGGSKKVK